MIRLSLDLSLSLSPSLSLPPSLSLFFSLSHSLPRSLSLSLSLSISMSPSYTSCHTCALLVGYFLSLSLFLSLSISMSPSLYLSRALYIYISFVAPPYLVRMHMLVRTQLSHVRITCWLRVLTRTPFHCATSLACSQVLTSRVGFRLSCDIYT